MGTLLPESSFPYGRFVPLVRYKSDRRIDEVPIGPVLFHYSAGCGQPSEQDMGA